MEDADEATQLTIRTALLHVTEDMAQAASSDSSGAGVSGGFSHWRGAGSPEGEHRPHTETLPHSFFLAFQGTV